MKTIKSILISILFVPVLAFAHEPVMLPNAGLTPESAFYFVDKIGEALREFFTFNPESKAHLQIDFAAERIAEIKIILETKGVNAKGLEVAEARLREHLGDAAEIVIKQKNKGKDVSELAKSISEGFDANKKVLKQAFKDQERSLEAKEDDLKAKIREARQAGDTAGVEALLKELGEIKSQKELLELKEEEQEEALEQEEEKIEREMDKKEEAEKAIKEAEEEKQEILDEAAEDGVSVPAEAFEKFDRLLAQAKELFAKENYVGAKQLAKQAEDALKKVEEAIEDLDETKEEKEELKEEQEEQAKEVIKQTSPAPKPANEPVVQKETIQEASAQTPTKVRPAEQPAAVPVSSWVRKEVSCAGKFFDTHVHFDGLVNAEMEIVFGHGNAYTSLTPKELAKRMSENGIGCGILFVSIIDMNKDYDAMRESISDISAGFKPFISIYESTGNFSLDTIKQVYEGREEAFFGIGEYGFYTEPLLGTSFAAEPWPEIYNYAAGKNLFLMLHPTQKQASEIGTMLSQYPNTKVILHGFELLGTPDLVTLLRNHKNLYWTYDLATMLDGNLYRLQDSASFISWFDANKQQYLNSVRSKLLPLLEAAPVRVMWGTDIVAAWHGETAVFSRLMEFSRSLVDSLPAEHRDNFESAIPLRFFGST